MTRVPDRPKQDKEAGLPKERVGGRFVTTYDPEIALRILEKVAEGHTINKICAAGSGFPHPVTFKRWILNNPELARAYDVAYRLSAGSLEEEALEQARAIRLHHKDGTEVRATEVLLSQLRWSASRRDPAKFGDKAPISVRVPINIHTTLDLGEVADDKVDGKSIYKVSAMRTDSVENAVEASKDTEIVIPLVTAKQKK